MLDSVRSSIIAATFRVNDRPNAKPNRDASFPDFRNLGGKDIDGERRLMYVGVTRHNSGLPAQPLACKLLILKILRDVRVVEGARLESEARHRR